MDSFHLGILLNVPFKEKDEAKALGAWWDPERKKWYVPRGTDSRAFQKWLVPKQPQQAEKRANG
jgi:hypothetical protein